MYPEIFKSDTENASAFSVFECTHRFNSESTVLSGPWFIFIDKARNSGFNL